jgi:hypothetical protein
MSTRRRVSRHSPCGTTAYTFQTTHVSSLAAPNSMRPRVCVLDEDGHCISLSRDECQSVVPPSERSASRHMATVRTRCATAFGIRTTSARAFAFQTQSVKAYFFQTISVKAYAYQIQSVTASSTQTTSVKACGVRTTPATVRGFRTTSATAFSFQTPSVKTYSFQTQSVKAYVYQTQTQSVRAFAFVELPYLPSSGQRMSVHMPLPTRRVCVLDEDGHRISLPHDECQSVAPLPKDEWQGIWRPSGRGVPRHLASGRRVPGHLPSRRRVSRYISSRR